MTISKYTSTLETTIKVTEIGGNGCINCEIVVGRESAVNYCERAETSSPTSRSANSS